MAFQNLVDGDAASSDVDLVDGEDASAKSPPDGMPSDPSYMDADLATTFVERFEGDRNEDGFFHGRGKAVLLDGAVYEGDFHNGYMHGNGILKATNGTTYTGQFMSGRPVGKGTILWQDGSKYVGGVNGVRHGNGVYHNALSQTTYDGDWVNGSRHGQGTMMYRCEQGQTFDVYVGQWADNLRHGRGKLTFSNGNSYDGDWVKGKRHGNGEFFWAAEGAVVKGKWKEGELNGHGEHRWLDETSIQLPVQTRYVGDFENGLRHGVGTLHYSNGAQYRGGWVGGMKHGAAEFEAANGIVFKGTFDQDVFQESIPPEIARQMSFTKEFRSVTEVEQSDIMSPLSGGTHCSEQAPLSSLLGDVGKYGSASVDVTRTFNHNVAKLLPAMDEESKSSHLAEVRNVLVKYLDHVQSLYAYYCALGKTEEEEFALHLMSRYQFWVLAHDTRLHRHGYTMADLDRLTGRGTVAGPDLHDPAFPIPMRVFLQWITFIAQAIYGDSTEAISDQFPLAKALEIFMRTELTPAACVHQSVIFQEKAITEHCRRFMALCEDIFESLCSMETQSRRCRLDVDGEQPLPTCRDFIILLAAMDVWTETLAIDQATRAINALNPSALRSPSCPDMDVEITLYQLVTALASLALTSDVASQRAASRQSKAHSVASQPWNFHSIVSRQSKTASATTKTPPIAECGHKLAPPSLKTSLERYVKLFQNKLPLDSVVGSITSLDALASTAPGSRQSATPTAGGGSASHSSLGGTPGRFLGSTIIVDSPVPEVVPEPSIDMGPGTSLDLSLARRALEEATEQDGMDAHQSESVLALDDTDEDFGDGASGDAERKARLDFFFLKRLASAYERWKATPRLECSQ